MGTPNSGLVRRERRGAVQRRRVPVAGLVDALGRRGALVAAAVLATSVGFLHGSHFILTDTALVALAMELAAVADDVAAEWLEAEGLL